MPAPRPLTIACQDSALDGVFLQICGTAFTNRTGRPAIIDPLPYNYDAVADMVDDGATRWDVCKTDAAECALMGRAGLLAMIDWALVDKQAAPVPLTVPWWGVPAYLYSYVLAYDRAAIPSAPPTGWRDFWDTAGFPGRRILPANSVTGVCEAALLGAGATPDSLYPVNADAALGRFKLLHGQTVFAPDEAACMDKLAQGQGSMAFLHSTSAHLLRLRTQGRIDFTWNQAILAPSLFCVPKEAPSGDDAMRFIAAAQDPAIQIQLLKFGGCGPVNPLAEAALEPELMALDPGSPIHRQQGLAINAPWYVDNLPWLQQRWASFTTG